MSRLVPTPMPVVLATTPSGIQCLKQAADEFGEGSQAFRMAQRAFPNERLHHCYPPMTPAQIAADAAYRRAVAFGNIATALAAVGQCIALVDAHARALWEVSTSDAIVWSTCRSLAFQSLAFLYERTPELLPIGPAVHADCGIGDDR